MSRMQVRTYRGSKQKIPGVGVGARKLGACLKKKRPAFLVSSTKIFFKKNP
jgi:hypothetical protein